MVVKTTTYCFAYCVDNSVFVLRFALFSFLVPCARLSWPSRQLLCESKYVVLYRNVIICMQLNVHGCVVADRFHGLHHSSAVGNLVGAGVSGLSGRPCSIRDEPRLVHCTDSAAAAAAAESRAISVTSQQGRRPRTDRRGG